MENNARNERPGRIRCGEDVKFDIFHTLQFLAKIRPLAKNFELILISGYYRFSQK